MRAVGKAVKEDKEPTFRLWISGYLTEKLTVSEMFLIACNRLSLSLMLAIGLVSGSMTSVGYELPIGVLPPFLLVNALAPPILIFVAAGLVAGIVRLHHMLVGRRTGTSLTIPTVIPTSLAFVPTYLLIEQTRVLLIGAELNLTWYIVVVPYLPLVAISEILIGAIFKFLTPSILSKASGSSLIEVTAPAAVVKSDAEHGDATDVERVAVPDQAEPVFIDVGEHRIVASDIVLVEAEGNYVRLVTPDDCFLERSSLKEMTDKLSPFGMQVHRSKWISYAHVIDHSQTAGQLKVTMLGGHEVYVAVRRIKEVETAIARFRGSDLRKHAL